MTAPDAPRPPTEEPTDADLRGEDRAAYLPHLAAALADVPSHALGPAPSPLSAGPGDAPRCACQFEQGDRVCPVHPCAEGACCAGYRAALAPREPPPTKATEGGDRQALPTQTRDGGWRSRAETVLAPGEGAATAGAPSPSAPREPPAGPLTCSTCSDSPCVHERLQAAEARALAAEDKARALHDAGQMIIAQRNAAERSRDEERAARAKDRAARAEYILGLEEQVAELKRLLGCLLEPGFDPQGQRIVEYRESARAALAAPATGTTKGEGTEVEIATECGDCQECDGDASETPCLHRAGRRQP